MRDFEQAVAQLKARFAEEDADDELAAAAGRLRARAAEGTDVAGSEVVAELTGRGIPPLGTCWVTDAVMGMVRESEYCRYWPVSCRLTGGCGRGEAPEYVFLLEGGQAIRERPASVAGWRAAGVSSRQEFYQGRRTVRFAVPRPGLDPLDWLDANGAGRFRRLPATISMVPQVIAGFEYYCA